MEPIHHLPFSESTTSIRDEEDRADTVDLIEECWFFDNLLKLKPKMLRCYSDPCPSLDNSDHDMFVKKSDKKISKIPKDHNSSHPGLIRAPSLPPNIGREETTLAKLQSHNKMSKLTRRLSHQKVIHSTQLLPSLCKREGTQVREIDIRQSNVTRQSIQTKMQRAPSLPPYIGMESSDTKMGHSSQQTLTIHSQKSLSRYRPSRIIELESINTEGYMEMKRRYLNEKKTKKSLNDLEVEELQGFKDLGFTFENKDLIPTTVVNILPGLQEKRPQDLNPGKVQRPYLSEAWLVQSYTPPAPNLALTKKSHEDMKAQIKFWARSVASNVRQEC